MILREIKNMYIKNRLTEGVDFVRKEWLKADIPIIVGDMMTLPISSKNFEFKRNFIQLYATAYFATSDSNTNYIYYIDDFYNDSTAKRPKIWNNAVGTMYTSIYIGLGIHNIIANDSGVTISSATNTASLPWYGNPTNIKFSNRKTGDTHTIHLTSSIKVDGVIRYVPCQLLKSIPATLDANNIARQAGECGMYDSISGKFFGNVASLGTFTVEGDVEPETHSGLQQIYQNKLIEGVDYDVYTYLKGTGGCYIDTLINPAWNDQLSATTEVSGRPTVINPCILYASDSNTGIGVYLGGNWYKNNIPQYIVIHKVIGTDDYFCANNVPANAELYASFKVVNNFNPTVTFKVNGEVWTNIAINGTNIITTLPDTTYLIGSRTTGLNVLKLKNVRINSHNFTPCKLKCAIPRNLDAQCKERIAGECGMIDLISGKFYGNVANSGTFTVENDNNE